MKFYIISILINIALMFIPFVNPINKNIKENKKEKTININLSSSIFTNVENNENLENIQSSDNSFVSNSKKENKDIKQINERKNNENPKTNKEQKENITKSVSKLEQDTNKNNTQISNPQKNSESNTTNSTSSSNNTNNSISKSGNDNTNNKNATTNNNEKNSRNNGNVCQENKDYKVIYNPNLVYPIAATRLGISGDVVVNAKITFTSNGSVNSVSVSGGNAVFHNEAKLAAKKIKINVINPEMVKCTITKPFRFRPKA